MKFLRLLLRLLIILAVCAVIAAAVVFSPIVQTWYVQRLLAGPGGVQGSVEAVSAGWSSVRIEGLKMRIGAARLDVPTLELELPVLAALRERKLAIRRISANGWTIDLSEKPTAPAPAAQTGNPAGAPEAAGKENTPAPVPPAGGRPGLLAGLVLPPDFSVDEVDLEGDVVVAVPAGAAPTRGHVALKRGGLAAGRTGVFSLTLSALDLRLPANFIAARGELTLALRPTRTIERVDFKGELANTNNQAVAGLQASVARSADDERVENYQLELVREGRPVGGLKAAWSPADGTLAGEWRIDAQAPELVGLAAESAPDLTRLTGEGRFTIDDHFNNTRLAGRAQVTGTHWERWRRELARLGEATIATEFELRRTRGAIRVERASARLTGAQVAATARLLQPGVIDEATGAWAPGEPGAEGIEVTIERLPWSWLHGWPQAFAVTGGDWAGGLRADRTGDGWVLRSSTPFTSRGVSLQRGGATLLRNVDLAVEGAVRVTGGQGAWQAEPAKITFASGGKTLATIAGKVSREPGRDRAIALAGQWTADFDAVGAQAVAPGAPWLTARGATGDFTATIDSYVDVMTTLNVTGHQAERTLSGRARIDWYDDSTIAIAAPLQISFAEDKSDLEIEWEWRGDAPKRGVDLKLKSARLALAHLQRLARPLQQMGQPADPDRRAPFWGDWTGRAQVTIDRLRTAEGELIDVGGLLKIAPDSVELLGGHGGPEQKSFGQVEAKLTHDPARAASYELTAAVAATVGDAERIFGAPPPDKEPVFKGRFDIERALTARGATLAELMARREVSYKLTSKLGIVRLLKTGVAQTLPPPPPSPVKDALGDVGTGFARIFGAKTKSILSGEIKVGAVREAVLDYDSAMAEIGYDRLVIAAVRHADGAITVQDLELLGSEVHLTGRGAVEAGADENLKKRALQLDLHLALQGRPAELLAKTGLLSETKDAQGYRIVETPIKAEGNLLQLKQEAWRAKLAEAAIRPTAKEAKK